MQAILFAILAYVGWGTGDIFATKATRKIGAFSTTFWTYIFSLVIFVVYIPFAIPELHSLTSSILVLNTILAFLYAASYFSFVEALRTGNPTVVGTICGSFVSVVVILSIVFLHEPVTIPEIAGIITIIFGVTLTSFNLKEIKTGFKLDRSIIFAIITMIGWGIYFTFIKIPIRQVGWFIPNYISLIVGAIILLPFVIFGVAKLKAPNNHKAMRPLLLEVLLTGGATFAFNYALQTGNTAIVAPIAGSYPTLFAVLSYLIFKEPLNTQQKVGIVISLLGIVALSFLAVS